MEYIRLGSTGMKVSRICLGGMSYGGLYDWRPCALEEEDSRPFIRRAAISSDPPPYLSIRPC